MVSQNKLNNYFPLQLSFLLFSMLLNSMGIIIMKYSGSHISYQKLGILEAFKDIPIALVSLVAVNFINRFGTKQSLIFSLTVVLVCCLALPFLNEFWFFKIWLVLIGVSFAIAKISVFSIIRNNVKKENELSKIMSRVEASFMIGIFCVNMGFGWLLSSKYEEFWKFGFWGIALISLITIWKLFKADYVEIPAEKQQYLSKIKSIFNFRNMLFFLVLFLIVLVEQCFNSWLPTFYKKNLHVNSFYALQSGAFLALFSFLGRMITSKIITRFSWFRYVIFCLLALILLILISQYLVNNINENLWMLLFLFPVLGLFMSPLYPLFNSKFLINIDKDKVNILVSFIVIFSSLGSSFGSIGMSYVFELGLDQYFILFALIPIVLILITTLIFSQRLILRQ